MTTMSTGTNINDQIAMASGSIGGSRVRAPIAPRVYRGDMGLFMPTIIPDVGAGGPLNLLISFMYPRYPADWRAQFRSAWAARGSLDVLLSWQDDVAYGLSLDQIIAIREELCAAGFRPCEWLMSKTYMQAAGAQDNAPL